MHIPLAVPAKPALKAVPMRRIKMLRSLIYPAVSFLASVADAIRGIGGGMAGRAASKRMVDKLFTGLMAVIILMSISNAARYSIG